MAPSAPAPAAQVNGHTPAEWEEMAQQFEAESRASAERSRESFERCDTDGFLSQWASDVTAQLNRQRAAWARNFGMDTVAALFDLNGAVISTHQGDGQWGPYWVLTDEAAARFGRRFVNTSKARKDATRVANNAKKGFSVGRVQVRGTVQTRGESVIGVRPVFCPDIDALRAGEFEITETVVHYGDE